MATLKSPMEFLSKCWTAQVTIDTEYHAFGNTKMKNLLEDVLAPDEVDILLLGVGDIRHLLKTVAGVCRRSPSAGIPKTLRFTINDIDMAILARDIILLEIINQVDVDKRQDVEFLWNVWYNFTLLTPLPPTNA